MTNQVIDFKSLFYGNASPILRHMDAEDIDIIIGRNLRRIRYRMGLTQEAIGNLIGNPKSKISAIESGQEGLGKELMARLCTALSLSLWEFYLDDQTPLPQSNLEEEALYFARSAEKVGQGAIAENLIGYGKHSLNKKILKENVEPKSSLSARQEKREKSRQRKTA